MVVTPFLFLAASVAESGGAALNDYLVEEDLENIDALVEEFDFPLTDEPSYTPNNENELSISSASSTVILQWKQDMVRTQADEGTLCKKEGAKPGVLEATYLKNIGICILTFDPDNSDASVRTFSGREDLEFAEPDEMFYMTKHPNDQHFSKQWCHYQRSDKDMDTAKAWDITTGKPTGEDVIVAVIDTGVDYTHEDLRNRMWINPGEGSVPDGKDNDGNGIVDDIYGADFANNDGDPQDDHGHGTHCAGIIAAEGNNKRGVTGVAWEGVKIMALKFLRADNGGKTSNALKCLDYALEKGAMISSNSWGSQSSGWKAFLAALQKAEKDFGHLFIAAAGNDSENNDIRGFFPCNYQSDNVLCVASTDAAGNLSSFSNYGKRNVHVGAPGSKILSCKNDGKNYTYKSGTSMACPNVAGIAALMKTYRPDLSWLQLKTLIMETTEKTAAMDGKVMSNGRVNAFYAMVAAADAPKERSPPAPTPAPTPVLTGTDPSDLFFFNEDQNSGRLAGPVYFNGAGDDKGITSYRIMWPDRSVIGEVSATGARMYRVMIPPGTTMKYTMLLAASVYGGREPQRGIWISIDPNGRRLDDGGSNDFFLQQEKWLKNVDWLSGLSWAAMMVCFVGGAVLGKVFGYVVASLRSPGK